MTDLDYLKLSKPAKMAHDLGSGIAAIPGRIVKGFKGLGLRFVKLFKGLGASIADLVTTFKDGDWKTRLSYLVMGFGSCARGQWGRGILFFLFHFPCAFRLITILQPLRTITRCVSDFFIRSNR